MGCLGDNFMVSTNKVWSPLPKKISKLSIIYLFNYLQMVVISAIIRDTGMHFNK